MRYEYEPHIQAEVDRAVRRFFARGSRVVRSPVPADWAGVDYLYRVDARCPVAVRCRYDRPGYAANIDVTWRSTEPAKMAAGTYAPLALFLWFRGGLVVAGRGVDVYRMHAEAAPPLAGRPLHRNTDGTTYLTVSIEELRAWKALLRIGDRDHWVTEPLDGDRRIERIVDGWGRPAPRPPPQQLAFGA